MNVSHEVECITGRPILQIDSLSGGSVGKVYLLHMGKGTRLVAKVDEGPEPRLNIEGFMLDFLREESELPVPKRIHCDPRLLIMEFMPGSSTFSISAQQDAAEKLAALHALTARQFGLHCPTLIGGLHQPNTWRESWIEFFTEQRLLYMTEKAVDEGRLPVALATRITALAARLDRLLLEPDKPALLHGDVWTTNVLAGDGRVTAFLDPAIYYGAPEIELAFITLFSTFREPFFARYHELRPIAPGFFEERRHIYNLYPLLVHVRLFGGGYVGQVEQTLRRFGL
jgi:fructosamine-3-kinase